MIGYDERGIIESYFMKIDECESYLRNRYISYCENGDVKIDSILYGEKNNGEYKFTYIAELLFNFNEHKVTVKWKDNGNILSHELRYGEVKIGSEVLFDEKIISLKYLSSVYSFNFNNCDGFNDCLVCVELLEKLLLKAEKNKNSIPNPDIVVIDNKEELEQQRLLEEQREKEQRKQEELQKKQARIEKFNTWFFKEYKCRKCGKLGCFSSNVCIVDDNGNFSWGANAQYVKPHITNKVIETLIFFHHRFLKEYLLSKKSS